MSFKLEIYSFLEDKLELDIEEIDAHIPKLLVGSLDVGGISHPWHIQWQNLKIVKFIESLDKVRDKIVYFYSLEKNRCCPANGSVVIRKPGHAKIDVNDGMYLIRKCKILNCKITNTIMLELAIDEVEFHDK